MSCSVLQQVVVCCSVLQCVAVCCSAQCIAVWCSVLHYVAVRTHTATKSALDLFVGARHQILNGCQNSKTSAQKSFTNYVLTSSFFFLLPAPHILFHPDTKATDRAREAGDMTHRGPHILHTHLYWFSKVSCVAVSCIQLMYCNFMKSNVAASWILRGSKATWLVTAPAYSARIIHLTFENHSSENHFKWFFA